VVEHDNPFASPRAAGPDRGVAMCPVCGGERLQAGLISSAYDIDLLPIGLSWWQRFLRRGHMSVAKRGFWGRAQKPVRFCRGCGLILVES
jgi:hypothetical protein